MVKKNFHIKFCFITVGIKSLSRVVTNDTLATLFIYLAFRFKYYFKLVQTVFFFTCMYICLSHSNRIRGGVFRILNRECLRISMKADYICFFFFTEPLYKRIISRSQRISSESDDYLKLSKNVFKNRCILRYFCFYSASPKF